MVTWILVNIGAGNGLLLDGTKPLPEPMRQPLAESVVDCQSSGIHHQVNSKFRVLPHG